MQIQRPHDKVTSLLVAEGNEQPLPRLLGSLNQSRTARRCPLQHVALMSPLLPRTVFSHEGHNIGTPKLSFPGVLTLVGREDTTFCFSASYMLSSRGTLNRSKLV